MEGNIEQIRDGVEGFLVPPGNPEAMAQKIECILSDPALHRRFREKAASRALDFEWSRMVDRYEAHFEKVLQDRAE